MLNYEDCHTNIILNELGYSKEKIKKFKMEKII